MANAMLERPAFFEGQYLGADDLTLLVRYVRGATARQTLGHHTWGIVFGLELVEVEATDGTLELHVQPGVAFDGFGRAIVVTARTRLEVDLFTGAPSGEFPVWIRYAESTQQGVRRGFEVCSTDDVFSRVEEAFELAIGVKDAASELSDPIEVNGESLVDPRLARRAVDENAPIVCDASIPSQGLPDDDAEAVWFVPLGVVVWQAGSPGSFKAREPETLGRDRRLRRYAGAVAESLFAPNGIIRLRERFTPFDATKEVDEQCTAGALTASDFCDDGVRARELVWLEGNVRVLGDARLFAGNLEFRDADGRDYVARTVEGAALTASAPLLLRRKEDNGRGGSDLQILLGKGEAHHRQRLSIAHTEASGDACAPTLSDAIHFVVQDDGTVGIGAVDTELGAPLTIRGTGDKDELVAFEDSAKLARWALNLGSAKTGLNIYEIDGAASRLYVAQGGKIGLGTETPGVALHVKGLDPDLFLDLDATSPNSLTELRFGSDGVVRSNIFWSKATGKTYLANQGVNTLVLASEKLGLGTDSPATTLQVATGQDVSLTTHGFLMLGDTAGLNVVFDDNEIQARKAGAASDLYLQYEGANVSLGALPPTEKLHVVGNVKLGASGELFAPGAAQNLRIVTGAVNGSGGIVSGVGFFVTHTATGVFTVTFTPGFAAAPVVVSTLFESSDANDEIVSVHGVSAASFTVRLTDADEVVEVDQGFSFVAFGTR